MRCFVVKGGSCSRRAATNRVRRAISVSVATNAALFGKSICHLSAFGKMTLPRLKSILAGFCKLNHPKCRKICILG